MAMFKKKLAEEDNYSNDKRKKNIKKHEKNKKISKNEEGREPQYIKSTTGDILTNYNVYYLSFREKIFYFSIMFIVGAAVGYLFYGGIGKDAYGEPTKLTYILDVIIMLTVGFVSGKVFLPIRQEQILNSRKKKLKYQFRDMLEALSTSLGTGKNVADSFHTVQEDLSHQYEEDAFILNELYIINTGMRNGLTIEQLLQDFGKRSSCSDIIDFANVFEISYRIGGDPKEIIKNTCQILTDKMNIEEEIETTVSGSKNEQYIMLVMPIALVGMIKLSSAEFAANFTTPSGLLATTMGVACFIAAYFLGKKMLVIKV